MDPNAVTTAAAAPSSLLDWIAQYGNYVAFIAQIVYWLGMLILIAYAVAQYKRWVNYQLGTGKSGKLRTDIARDEDTAVEKDEAVSVEEFVD